MIDLKIETGNAAFQDGNGPSEAARILRSLANDIERLNASFAFAEYIIRDANGNTCGSCSVRLIDSSSVELG